MSSLPSQRLNLQAALAWGEDELKNGSSARLDSELLLAHAIAADRATLYRDGKNLLEPAAQAEFHRLIAARRDGIPLAQLRGYTEFWSLHLVIDEYVLIPRPETEHLVELALRSIQTDEALNVADIGTGSGAIAIALAKERPQANIFASDRSRAALRIAEINRQAHNCAKLYLFQADWLSAIPDEAFDLILSNPPYIEADDCHLIDGDIRFEPTSALAAGADGLDAIRKIVTDAQPRLRAGGRLALEHGYNQGARVRALFASHGYEHIETLRDLAGHERLSTGTKSE